MFQERPQDTRPGDRGWSFASSLLLQALAVAGLILLPLFDTYEIRPGDWAGSAFRLAVPAPPTPRPPAAAAPRPAVARYEASFSAPNAIPERVALLADAHEAGPVIAAPPAPRGAAGGLAPGAGVMGLALSGGPALPAPPPIRVGGRIQNARILRKVQPVYPQEAIEQQVSGVVKLEAVIGTNGAVRDLKLIQGHPMLAGAAMDAVSQWLYRPTRLNDREVEVVTLIDVVFNLRVLDEKEAKRLRRQQRAKRTAQ